MKNLNINKIISANFQRTGMAIAFVFAMLFSSNVQATHIVGGELTYECLGGDQYEVTLTVYRDCFFGASNAPFDDPAAIGVFNGTSGFRIDVLELPLTMQDDTIATVIADTCLFVPSTVCVHTTTYSGIVTLPDNGIGYTLSYQRCCRNQTIMNIVNPLETGATFVTFITPEALDESQCNSQATFDDWPPIFICVNEPINYSHAATDTDGDSLVYKLCQPFTGGTLDNPQPVPPAGPPYDNVVWNAGFGTNNMLGGNNPMTIDPNTGFITGVPPQIGQFVVGVCVEEYRDGILIAETRRDFQYNVGPCGIVESIIGNPDVLCDVFSIEFENESTNSTEFVWDFGDPTTTDDVSTEFEPTYTYPDTGVYTVTLTSEPNSDCIDVLEWEIHVKEVSLMPNFEAHVFPCQSGSVLVEFDDLSTDIRNDIISWFWELSDGQTSTDQFPSFIVDPITAQNFTATLTLTDSEGCDQSVTQNLPPTDPMGTLPNDAIICAGESVDLFPEFFDNSPLNFAWSPAAGLNNANIANPTATPLATTSYSVTITSPAGACVAVVDKLVTVSDFTDLGIEATITNPDGTTTVVSGQDEIITCEESTVTLSTTTSNSTGNQTIQWTDQSGNVISTMPTVTINPDGSQTYTVSINDDNGCAGTASVTVVPGTVDVEVEELVNVGGGSGITDVDGDGTLDICVGETSSVLINNLDPNDMLTYSWTAANGLIVAGADSNNPTIFGFEEGVFTMFVTSTNQFGCDRTDEVLIHVHNVSGLSIQADITDLEDNSVITFTDENTITNCNGNSTITLTEITSNTSGTTTIVWTDENGNVLGNDNNVTIPPGGDFTYTVTVTDIFGCSASEEITILGNPVDVSIVESTTVGGGSGIIDIDGDGDFDLCLGSSTSFTVENNNASDQLTYTWTGDTQIITSGINSPNPSIEPSTGGIFNLVVVAENQYGCISETPLIIDVTDIPDPVLDFTFEQDCAGTTINFNSNNPAFEFYIWDFGDGSPTVTGVQSPSHTYADAGNYSVTLIPVGGTPCTLPTQSQNIEVADSDFTIDFSFEYLDCSESSVTIQFTDLSSILVGTITGFNWTFSDGQSSTDQNPTITINQNTSLTATLTIINSANCDGSAVQNLDINLIEDPGFPAQVIACPNEGPVELNPNGGNPDYTYTWSPVVGLNSANEQNPMADPGETTVYSVTVTDNTGADVCEIFRQVEVIVPDGFEINVSADGTSSGTFPIDNSSETNTVTTCESEIVTITTTSTTGTNAGFDISWTDENGNPISDINSISVEPGATRTFTVTYTDEFGCTESREITVEGGPVDIDIQETTIDDGTGNGIGGILTDGFLELCLGQSFELNITNLDPDDILSFTWTGNTEIISNGVNTGNAIINPSEAGSYTLNLLTTNQFGCTRNDVIQVNVIDANAVLSFEEVKDCNGVTVLFTNTSTGNNDDYLWTFGDTNSNDNTSTEIDPSHTYPGVGSYPVTLSLETNVTCVDDFNQGVDIVAPILASSFSYEFIECDENGVTIQFNEETINPQDNTTAFFWDFGNGETSVSANPQLTFTGDDLLNVTLTIFTDLDCESASPAQVIEVSIIDDIASPGSILACENEGPQMIQLNGDPDYIYEWSPAAGLDDPTSPNPIADPGVTTLYSVTITDNNGTVPCSIVREVEINVPASIEIELPQDFNTDCTDFADVTAVSSNSELSYEWFDSDGNSISNTADLSVIDLSGDNTYILIATDVNGCQQEEQLTITGTQLDVSIDDLQYLCLEDNGELTVISNADPDDVLTINWVGPNIISGGNTMNPVIQTDNPNETTYFVEVTNQFGCSASDSVTVVVLDTARPNITQGQCEGTTISFFNDSPSAEFYTWDFGDGNTSNEANPMHTYDEPGDYVVTLTLPNGNVCENDLSLDVRVDDMPDFPVQFDFFYDQCDNAGMISFTDQTVSTNQGEIISWEWIFDPGTTSNDQNTQIMVDENGEIEVTLTVLTDAGCESTLTQNVPLTLIDTQVDLEDIIECVDLEADLNDEPNMNYEYEWSPAGGLSDPNSPNPTVIAGTTTEYTVTITDNNQNGCTSVQTMTLEVPPRIDMEVAEDEIHCEELTVDIFATSDVPGVTFQWSLDPNFTTTIAETGDILAETGRPNIYYVMATDESGCVETDQVIVADYGVQVDPTDTEIICLGDDAELQIINQLSGSDTLTYVWTGPDILDGGDTASPVINPSENAVYMAEITNQFGCSVIDTVVAEVIDMDALITEVTPAQDTIFIGNETQINVTEGPFTYDWSPPLGLDDSTIPDPTASPEETTDYTVTVMDANGCLTTGLVSIVVLSRACDEPFIFFPNAFSPNNDGENDVLRLRANAPFIDEVYWIVYNRWGEKMFEGNSLDDSWDGVCDGELAQPDVYGYYLRVLCTDGEEFIKKGNVTILR